MVVMSVVILGKTTMIAIVTDELTMIVIATEDVIMIVNANETEEWSMIVTEELIAIGKEILLVAVMEMSLSRPELLADFRIKALAVARIRTSREKGETSLVAFPEFYYNIQQDRGII